MAKFNSERLLKKIQEVAIAAFVDTCNDLDTPLKESISSDIWEWPRITHRRSGEVVGSPRNIIDLGNLQKSQKLFFESWTYAVWAWNVDYAIYVHEGYTNSNGTEFPARPWVSFTLENYDIRESFINNLNKYL
jgi:hypothetical protein